MHKTMRLAVMIVTLAVPVLAQAGGGGSAGGGTDGGSHAGGAHFGGSMASAPSGTGAASGTSGRSDNSAWGAASPGDQARRTPRGTSLVSGSAATATGRNSSFNPAGRIDPVNSSDPSSQPKIEMPR